jgi:uncharacterized membrane protein YphA (DoxX/SURF4 family)
MGTKTAAQKGSDLPFRINATEPRWSVTTLLLFRFAFVYLGLYSLVPIDMAAERTFHDHLLFPAIDRFWVTLSVWTATHLLQITDFNPRYLGSDSVVSWARLKLLVLIALATTVVWSFADRRRKQYSTLHEWQRLIIRVSLGLTMVSYGVQKIMVVQMAPISPHELTAPLGYFAPRQLLWAFMGASPGYEAFTGAVEVVGGALLFFPQLTALGALVVIVAMTNVFLLNVFYDVAVKVFSFHLLLMAGFLLLPDVPRLAAVLLFNREAAPVERPKLFPWDRRLRLALTVPLIFGIAVIGWTVSAERSIDMAAGQAKPNAVPFFGIWDVVEFTVADTPHPPLTTDEVRWQKIIFDDRGYVSIQRMDGTLIWAFIKIDQTAKAITFDHTGKPHPDLRKLFGDAWKANFTFNESSPELLILTGTYNEQPATVTLQKDHTRYFLSPHERHWVLRARPVLPYL